MRLAWICTRGRVDRLFGGPSAALAVLAVSLLCGACMSTELSSTPTGEAWEAQVQRLVDTWPVGTYAVLDRGREVGRMTMRQSVVRDETGARLLLEDAARISAPGGERPTVDLTYSSRCRLDDHFTPVLIESQQSPGQDDSRLVVHDGRASGNTFERDVDIVVPDRFVIRQGLMRLVSLLPREAGRSRTFAFLSLGEEPEIDIRGQVRCVGPEPLDLAGVSTPAWRYEYLTLPGTGPRRPVSMWVGEDGRFLRFHDDEGLQLVLLQADRADGEA
jgi:hypothetical protein